MHFYKEMIAAYYDCDRNNFLKPAGMLRYMQQASSEDLTNMEMSPELLYERGLVFLLSKTNLKIHRYPLCSEKLRIGTSATGTKGVRFIREFMIFSNSGERLVSAYSLWVLTDIVNHKILRPTAYPYQIELMPPEVEEFIGDIPIPKEKEISCDAPRVRIEIPVRYSHIDINRHVNNCVYADFVCDSLPYGELSRYGLDTLALSFVSEAVHGEVIEIERAVLREKEYHLTGRHGGGVCFEALAMLGNKEIGLE